MNTFLLTQVVNDRARSRCVRTLGSLVTLLAISIMVTPPTALAQEARVTSGDAELPGTVSGALIPAANAKQPITGVTVTIEETGDKAIVDRHGEFTFQSVRPGTYTLVATGDGFSRLKITDVVVHPDHALTLGSETMPVITKDGEVQLMEEVVVNAKKEGVETMTPVIVNDVKPQPFSDRNVDLPRTIDDVQPYYIFNSQTIEESGTTDVEDFLKERLTTDATVQTNSQITLYQSNHGFQGYPSTASSIDLQGLGPDHTLILVDGLPMAGVSVFAPQSNGGASAPGQPDVNGIPLSAIDRIEVLPSSAGAIYGVGAEGGVINIVLKKAYTGGDITATYGSTWDGYGATRTLEATFGKSFEGGKTQLFVTAQYSDQSPMFIQDRIGLVSRGTNAFLSNDEISDGGSFLAVAWTQFPFLGATPNITSVPFYNSPSPTSGVGNLTLKSTGASLNSPIATLPAGYSATSNPSGIVGGQWNLSPGEDNEGPGGLLVPLNYPRRKTLMATLTRQMTSKLELHADFSIAENHSYSDYNPIQGEITVPSSSPDNPFNQDVYVTFPIEYNSPATSDSIAKSVTVGGTLKLPFGWIAHLDYRWSESAFESTFVGGLNNDALSSNQTFSQGIHHFPGEPPNPLSNDNDVTPLFSGTIDPLVDTLAYPINWAPFTYNTYQTGTTTADDLILAASGPLFHLPWGDPRLSVRLEHNKSGEPQGALFSETPTDPANIYPGLPEEWYTQTSYGQTETTNSANGELDLPVFKSKWPLLRSLDAQFNISNETAYVGTGSPGYDIVNPYPYNTGPDGAGPGFQGPIGPLLSNGQPYRYTTTNSNTSYTWGLSYKPVDDVIIRFSEGSGYVAPTYQQLLPDLTPDPGTTAIIDPKNPNAGMYQVQSYSGGNPELKPETSKSWDIGGIWQPKSGILRGLRFDAEFTETKQHNLIYYPGLQNIVDFESDFPNLVVRDPTTGLITTVYNEPINANEAKNDLWSLTLDYQWKTAIGSFDLSGAETIEEHNERQFLVGQPFLDYVGWPNSAGVAKTKANATLRWAFRNWIAAWTVVYFDGYNQYGAPGDPEAYQGLPIQNNLFLPGFNPLQNSVTQPQGGYTIPSQMYHNLYVSYTFRKGPFGSSTRMARWSNVFLENMSISLNVNNVFNTLPAFDAFYAPFYTSSFGDIQLRNYSVSVKKAF